MYMEKYSIYNIVQTNYGRDHLKVNSITQYHGLVWPADVWPAQNIELRVTGRPNQPMILSYAVNLEMISPFKVIQKFLVSTLFNMHCS